MIVNMAGGGGAGGEEKNIYMPGKYNMTFYVNESITSGTGPSSFISLGYETYVWDGVGINKSSSTRTSNLVKIYEKGADGTVTKMRIPTSTYEKTGNSHVYYYDTNRFNRQYTTTGSYISDLPFNKPFKFKGYLVITDASSTSPTSPRNISSSGSSDGPIEISGTLTDIVVSKGSVKGCTMTVDNPHEVEIMSTMSPSNYPRVMILFTEAELI